MWREVARFEARLQRREFLTGVYAAVFFFLTFGYMSSEVVELVGGRGSVARNAPWALAHAMAGVTAFGQVITTMITATAVMRDVATRQQELLFTTRLARGDYLMGRWVGALLVMLAVYAAIPLGLVLGSWMPWIAPGVLLPFDGGAYLRPLAVLVLPNVLVVSALFFTAGALGRSFMTILLLGVVLVAMWSGGVSLARDGVTVGALVDPFGNAALEAATRGWSDVERASRPLPLGGVLLANRALWLAVGGVVLGWLVRTFRFEVVGSTSRGRARDGVWRDAPRLISSAAGAGAPVGASASAATDAAASVPTDAAHIATGRHALRAPLHLAGWRQAVTQEARWTFRWTLRERGFATLAFLGTLNALANAWRAGGAAPSAGDILGAVQQHSRVFLILVATIYAGELVWREREVRVDGQRDALPVGSGTLVAGRVAGLLAAQGVLVLPLLLVALGVGCARDAAGMGVLLAGLWVGGFVYAFLAQLTLLSLLLHAAVQHKVAGHVLLILGWVLAIALERAVAVPALARYANLPTYGWSAAAGFSGRGALLAMYVGYWSAAAAVCAVAASALWVRGVPGTLVERIGAAMRALATSHRTVFLLAIAVTASAAVWIAAYS